MFIIVIVIHPFPAMPFPLPNPSLLQPTHEVMKPYALSLLLSSSLYPPSNASNEVPEAKRDTRYRLHQMQQIHQWKCKELGS